MSAPQTKIDLRTVPSNVPVLCIPRVYPNITEKFIRETLNDLNMGEIERIDMVSKTSDKGDKFNRVFIHYKQWNQTDNANAARERLLNGKEIKIIYDEPWFWKVSAYREPERSSSKHSHPHRKPPTIEFDDDGDKRHKRPYNKEERNKQT